MLLKLPAEFSVFLKCSETFNDRLVLQFLVFGSYTHSISNLSSLPTVIPTPRLGLKTWTRWIGALLGDGLSRFQFTETASLESPFASTEQVSVVCTAVY